MRPEVGNEYAITLYVMDEDDGLFECFIPELNQNVTLAETELEALEEET